MRRVGVLFTFGVLALSLVFLFKPRLPKPHHRLEAAAITPLPKSATATEHLNLNTASVEELESLPGIGPITARRIVEYREKHGPFARSEDVMVVEGIGEKKYRALADFVRVD